MAFERRRYLVIFRSDQEVEAVDVYASSPLEAVCYAKIDRAPPAGWKRVDVRCWPTGCRDVEDVHRKLA